MSGACSDPYNTGCIRATVSRRLVVRCVSLEPFSEKEVYIELCDECMLWESDVEEGEVPSMPMHVTRFELMEVQK